jgi:hypothetical protein
MVVSVKSEPVHLTGTACTAETQSAASIKRKAFFIVSIPSKRALLIEKEYD